MEAKAERSDIWRKNRQDGTQVTRCAVLWTSLTESRGSFPAPCRMGKKALNRLGLNSKRRMN